MRLKSILIFIIFLFFYIIYVKYPTIAIFILVAIFIKYFIKKTRKSGKNVTKSLKEATKSIEKIHQELAKISLLLMDLADLKEEKSLGRKFQDYSLENLDHQLILNE